MMKKLKEKENVCGMPLIAKIEVHQSEETGEYYLNWIAWTDKLPIGLWVDQRTTKIEANRLLGMLKYPANECLACGSRITRKDKKCPKCGHPLK